MFKFLKKLFSEEEQEEVKEEGIDVDDLDGWFKDKSDKIISGLDVKINDVRGRIKEEILKTKDNLAILSTSRLHNPKISVKENQFMEGNRKAYVMAVNAFLRGMDLDKEGHSDLLEFCDDFNHRLEKFGKSTVRTYHILQEFFAHESRNIAINIKNLGSMVGDLRNDINSAKVAKIDEIKGEIVVLKNKINQRKEVEKLLIEKEDVKSGLIRNKDAIEKEIGDLIKSKGYKHLNELKADKGVLLAAIREHNAKIVHAFSVMEKPLKKLTRVVIEEVDLLNRYMENPVETLVNDNELKIVGLLKKLEKNINNLTLELKDKKREKVLETVKGLTEEFLREFVNKHNELDNQLKGLENSINEDEALKEENRLNYELNNVQDNLEKVSGEIESSEIELGKIDIENMKKELSGKINDLLKVDVVIS